MVSTFGVFVVSLLFVPTEMGSVHSLAERFNTKKSWAPNCPLGSGKIPRLVPHRYNCRSMFLCSGGMPQEFLCPEGQVFSAERQECLKRTTCSSGNSEKWPAFESCPDDGKDYYFKHPEDCSMFYQCGPKNVAFPRRCPGKLHFNPKLNVCDWPQNVDCKSRLFMRRSGQEITREEEN